MDNICCDTRNNRSRIQAGAFRNEYGISTEFLFLIVTGRDTTRLAADLQMDLVDAHEICDKPGLIRITHRLVLMPHLVFMLQALSRPKLLRSAIRAVVSGCTVP